MIEPCEAIRQQIGELFTCEPTENAVKIQTPYLYPDGDMIDLYYRVGVEGPTLTDFGDTLAWLRQQSMGRKRTKRQRQIIADICLNHGVELFKGMLLTRVKDPNNFAHDVVRLSQAALRVSDLWFTIQGRAWETTTEEVEEFLEDHSIVFDKSVSLAGRTGASRRVDFYTRTKTKSSLIYVLSSGSRAAARNITEHVLATWYDLSNLKVQSDPLQFVSLFDDTSDVWREEDMQLVQDLSEVVLWSNPNSLLETLEKAA